MITKMKTTSSVVVVVTLLSLSSIAVEARWTCPRAGSGPSSPLPAGSRVAIRKSNQDEVCTLTKIKTVVEESTGESKQFLVPAGRSYNGRNWEPSAGPFAYELQFACGSIDCTAVLPQLEDPQTERFVLTSYARSVTPQEDVSRFLQQTTFGPTRDEIQAIGSPANVANWTLDQIVNQPATLHRPYFRKRANARLNIDLRDNEMAMGDKPCQQNARYRDYMAAWEEVRAFSQFRVSKPNNSTEWFLITDEFGYPRTEVRQSEWSPYISPGVRFVCCAASERVGGYMSIRKPGSAQSCTAVPMGNPKIHFNVSKPNTIVNFPANVQLTLVDESESKGSEVLLSQAISSSVCDNLPSGGGFPIHAVKSDNVTWYFHDPRVQMLDNTAETPAADGGGANALGRSTKCSNVPRTFLNAETCQMSSKSTTCSPYTTLDVLLELNDELLKDFFRYTKRYIYALNMTEPDLTPCSGAGNRARFVKRSSNTCTTNIPDSATATTITNLLSGSSDRNPLVKDIYYPTRNGGACSTSTPKGVIVKLSNGECWQHAHDDQFNIYDFTPWVDLHPGGKPAITQFATRQEVYLVFPYYKAPSHTQDRWTTNKSKVKYVGRFRDMLSYKDLTSELRVESVAQKYGASGETSRGAGLMVCGSPGEVANDPLMGDEFDMGMDGRWDRTPTVQDFEAQKFAVWNTIVVFGKDQLRQRMAWALSQILAMAVGDIDEPDETELYLNFYDIFVKHAFGNYRDILKEVAYSPMMAEMLTYIQSKSTGYAMEQLNMADVFPDENFAREIMQLFSVGLVKLKMNGEPVMRADGTYEQTYSNLDVMDNARAWTGFDRQPIRANIESISSSTNRIDPMRLYPEWRDSMPKADIYGGYIGDGVPLCVDLPPRQFLRIGAKYRLLGNSPTPDLQNDPNSWANMNVKRVVIKTTSPLFAKLCNASGGNCRYAGEVTLDSNLLCDGMECTIDQPRVVELEGKKVYFEYIRPPCVQFPFFVNALKIKERNSSAQSMCADPRLPAAEEACCKTSEAYTARASRNCAYTGERVTYPTARKRCQGLNTTTEAYDTCTWRLMGSEASECGFSNMCCEFNGFLWSSAECEISIKIDNLGQVSVVHNHTDLDTGTGDMRGWIARSVAPDNVNFFRVRWRHDAFPATAGSSSCTGQCTPSVMDDGCLCKVSVKERAVFSDLPTFEKALEMLKIGAVAPAVQGSSCVVLQSGTNIKAWDCTGSGVIDRDTIMEVQPLHRPVKFLKNTYSAVRINNGAFEFRNPPTFFSPYERDNKRDAEQETDAVLDQVFYHPNTAPFLSFRLIQRFGVSNPSPAYLEAVALAFSDGIYKQGSTTFGTGNYGDLAATAAAIVLHPEARAAVLDADPSYGSMREPILRVMQLFRSMEYKPNLYFFPHIKTISMAFKMGQMAHAIPSVFSFFLPDFRPPGRINMAELYSPEAGLTNTPNIMGLLGGMFSLIKYTLAECYSGFGPEGASCGEGIGKLNFSPSIPNDIDSAIQDLNLLLTAGRLSSSALAVIREAAITGANFEQQVQIAQQLVISAPEYHSTNVVTRENLRPEPPQPPPSPKPYKAVVFFFMAGGVDSYNVLVPDAAACPALYDMYNATRGAVAMQPSELSTPFSAGGTQPTCDRFALHNQASAVTSLYNSGDAILFANTGVLLEPCTKANWEEKHKPTILFAHDRQQREAMIMDPFQTNAGTGVMGRMSDALTRSGYKTGLLSIEGGTPTLSGEEGVGPLIKYLSRSGATAFDPVPSSDKVLPSIKKLNNQTKFDSGMFGELWSSYSVNALAENKEFVTALNDVSLTNGNFSPRSSTGQKMEIAAKLIKGHDLRGTDRDLFYVSLEGWDVHSASKSRTSDKLWDMNAALDGFSKEMKAQGRWDETLVVMVSEFGRTLTPNSGGGTDHGWGGNYWIAGGAVKGGKILGEYPTDYEALDTSRFRPIPTTSYDAIWNGVAEWFGVPDAELGSVLPNRNKFTKLFTKDDLFKTSTAASA